MTKRRKPRYWYRFYHGECPVCGSDKSFKERVCGKKPAREQERHVYLPQTETYDYCDMR